MLLVCNASVMAGFLYKFIVNVNGDAFCWNCVHLVPKIQDSAVQLSAGGRMSDVPENMFLFSL